MRPARWPRPSSGDDRLLLVDPRRGRLGDSTVGRLGERLRPGDVLIVNDAATLPASLPARGPRGQPVELRLLSHLERSRFRAVLFGEGDWRTPTEQRPSPPRLSPGESIIWGGELSARVEEVSPLSPRLLTVSFDLDGASLWASLYRLGRPVQYAYLERPLSLYHVQTRYGARPWAVEMPSAGRALTWEQLISIRKQGITIASLTHAAGLSSTGDPAIDEALPLPERYEIPAATALAVARAKGEGGRVVAVGTTVVRALEGAALSGSGRVEAGAGVTSLKLGPGSRLRVVDGLLTGVHERGSSHFELLRAFAPGDLLERASEHAERAGYLGHELGDSALILSA